MGGEAHSGHSPVTPPLPSYLPLAHPRRVGKGSTLDNLGGRPRKVRGVRELPRKGAVQGWEGRIRRAAGVPHCTGLREVASGSVEA